MDKQKILNHIRSAILWLKKAEELIENNQITRGLLNLFLADAEIRIPLKESVKKKEIPKTVNKFFKRLPAFTIAASIAILIFVSTYVITTQYQIAKKEIKKEKLQEKVVIKKEPVIIKKVEEEIVKEEKKEVAQVTPERRQEVKLRVIKKLPKRALIIERPKEEKKVVKEKEFVKKEEPVKKEDKPIIDEKIYELMKYAEDALKGKIE